MKSKNKYTCKNLDKIDGMKKVLSSSRSKKELEALSIMFILDESYPREDICLVLKEIKKEKGW